MVFDIRVSFGFTWSPPASIGATKCEEVQVYTLAFERHNALQFLMCEQLEDELNVVRVQQKLREVLEFEDI